MKNNISEYNREELIECFRNLKSKVEYQFFLIMELEKLMGRRKRWEEERKSSKTGLGISVVILFILTLIIVWLMNTLVTGKIAFYTFLICLAFTVIILSAVFIPIEISFKNENKQIDKKTQELRNSFINFREDNPQLDIIPFKYQTPIAIAEMTDYLVNYRAHNWTEAVNLLEETIYKNNMLFYQSRQTSILNQQMEQLRKIKESLNSPFLGITIGI